MLINQTTWAQGKESPRNSSANTDTRRNRDSESPCVCQLESEVFSRSSPHLTSSHGPPGVWDGSGGAGAAPGERSNTARQEEGTHSQSWALPAVSGGGALQSGGPWRGGGSQRQGWGTPRGGRCPPSTDGHGAACLSPPSPLMQLRPPWSQNVWMEGWRHTDPQALRQEVPWEGASHGPSSR